MTNVRNEIIRFGTQVDKASIQKMQKELGMLDKAAEKPGKALGGGLLRALDNFAYRAARASAVIDRHLTKPLSKLGQTAVASMTEVFDGLGEIQTLLQGSLQETTSRMEDYKDGLFDLSTVVVKSVKDMTGGLYEYISAFQELPKTMQGFTIASKVATAGLTSTTQAVDLLSSVSLAYNDTSTEMQQKISDLSFETVRLAKTHIPELADNISKVAPVASIMGMSLEEVFAMTSTLIGVTGDTTEVFTQLRRVILSMQKPNQTMVSLLALLGYVGADAGKQIISERGLVGAINALNTGAKEAGVSVEKAIGRIQGIMPVLAFQADEINERFKSMYEAISDPGGATESALEKYLSGIAKPVKDLESVKLEFERISIELGERLIPYLIQFYNIATSMFEKLLNKASFPALDKMIKDIGAIADSIANLKEGTLDFIVSLVTKLMLFGPVLGIMSAFLFTFEGILKGGKVIQRALSPMVKNLKIMQIEGSKVLAVVTHVGKSITSLGLGTKLTLMAIAAGLVVWMAKTIGDKLYDKAKEASDILITEFENIKSASVELKRELDDLFAMVDAFEQKREAIQIRVALEKDLDKYRKNYEELQNEIAETEASIANILKLYGAQQTITGMPPSGAGKALQGYQDALKALKLASVEAAALIKQTQLGIQAIDLEVIPKIDENIFKQQLSELVMDFDFSGEAFELDVLVGTSDLNKLNNALNISTNEFDNMHESLSTAFSTLESKLEEANTQISIMETTLLMLDPSMEGYEEYADKIQEVIDQRYREAEAIKYLMDQTAPYVDQTKFLVSLNADLANQYYEVTKQVNNVTNAEAALAQINKLVNENILPEDVLERLKLAGEYFQGILDDAEAIAHKKHLLSIMPDLGDDIKDLDTLWLAFNQAAEEQEMYTKILEELDKVIEETGEDYKEFREYLEGKIDTKPLTDMQKAIQAVPQSALAEYEMAEAILIADFMKEIPRLTEEQYTYFLGIREEYEKLQRLRSRELDFGKELRKALRQRPTTYELSSLTLGIDEAFREDIEAIWIDLNWAEEETKAYEKTIEMLENSIYKTTPKVQAFIDALKAKIPTEPLTEIQALIEGIVDPAEEYNLVVEALQDSTIELTDYQAEYFDNVIDGYKRMQIEAAKTKKIMEGFNKAFIGTKYEDAWIKASMAAIEQIEIVEALAQVEKDMAMAKSDLDDKAIQKAQDMREELEGQLEVLEEIKEEQEKIVNNWSLGSTPFGDFDLNLDTGEIEFEVSKLTKFIEGVFSGAIDPLTALIALFLQIPEVQEIMESFLDIFKNIGLVLGPALANVLAPLIGLYGEVGTYLALFLLPILDMLAPIIHMVAIILQGTLIPVLSILSPIIAILAGVIELLTPIIGLVAKALVYILSPIRILGTQVQWAADMVKGFFHNLGVAIGALITHPLSQKRRDKYIAERGGYTDMKELRSSLETRLDNTYDAINADIAKIDEALALGAGTYSESLYNDTGYYGNIATDPTSPFPSTDGGSGGGQGANINQFTQHNYFNINIGAVAGDFDEFVSLIERRMIELREAG